MIKKTFATVIFVFFLVFPISSFSCAAKDHNDYDTDEISNASEGGWYYLPSYPNYAPNGLPDFDQCSQNDWKTWVVVWSLCAPNSVANIFWWFDSKHADPNGAPGDGIDEYPLVKNLNAKGDPLPGPYKDDHCYSNVNVVDTPLVRKIPSGELVEQIAWYVNQNFRRHYFFRFLTAGTRIPYLKRGVEQWIDEAGLKEKYNVESIFKPEFSDIVERLHDNQGIILFMAFRNPIGEHFKIFKSIKKLQTLNGHYVSLAGINPAGYIALSDPFLNVANPYPSPMEHCNASVVSHDIYEVNFSSPCPKITSWWVPNYRILPISQGAFVTYAMAISEIE